MSSVPVIKPNWVEFQDFNKFIADVEAKGLHESGVIKVVPPPEWKPRSIEYENLDSLDIKRPLYQVVTGNRPGCYQLAQAYSKSMTVEEYRELAFQCKAPSHPNYDSLHRSYWQTLKQSVPVYGTEVEGSLIDSDCKTWNFSQLGSILDLVKDDYGLTLGGVTTPYLYFGMWKTSFAWHIEDMDLYSINFMHFGEPKTWLSIPPRYGRKFEELTRNIFPASYQNCEAHLRHKTTLIDTDVLNENHIPYNRTTQEANDIMITFPFAYHAGFNHGFNVNEAVNFATKRWIEYGKRAQLCHCGFRKSTVDISMDTFVQRFQIEQYNDWLNGNNLGCHPEEPQSTPKPAPTPSIQDVLINKNNKVTEDIVTLLISSSKSHPRRYQRFPRAKFQQCHPDIDINEIINNELVAMEIKKLFK